MSHFYQRRGGRPVWVCDWISFYSQERNCPIWIAAMLQLSRRN